MVPKIEPLKFDCIFGCTNLLSCFPSFSDVHVSHEYIWNRYNPKFWDRDVYKQRRPSVDTEWAFFFQIVGQIPNYTDPKLKRCFETQIVYM